MENSQFNDKLFQRQFLQIIQSNPAQETIAGLEILVRILQSFTIESSYKQRTILSQNTQINNELLSLSGDIEALLEAIGFTKMPLGNPSLKPNYIFKHVTVESLESIKAVVKQC
jgi:hypothetical protein